MATDFLSPGRAEPQRPAFSELMLSDRNAASAACSARLQARRMLPGRRTAPTRRTRLAPTPEFHSGGSGRALAEAETGEVAQVIETDAYPVALVIPGVWRISQWP